MPETIESSSSKQNGKVGIGSRLKTLATPILFGLIFLIIVVGSSYELSRCESGFRNVQVPMTLCAKTTITLIKRA